jgi:hypothetical protein
VSNDARRETRLGFVAVAAGVLGVLAIVAYARLAAPIVTDSDFAVGEVYVELATRAQLLLGPYSRFGWHHPGPLYFYVVAPFYALAGHQAAAIYAVALAVNLVAIAAIAWVTARETRGPLASALVGALLLFAWRTDRFLASPWTAHIPILPALGFLVIAAAVAAGRLRLLPIMIAFGSFAAQTHVGFAPTVLFVAVMAALIGTWKPADLAARRRSWWMSAVVMMVLWALPIVEALANHGGNVAALWRFFVVDPGAGQSPRQAIAAGSYGLAGIWRADFDLPWGGRVELPDPFVFIFIAILTVALLLALARAHAAAGRRFEAALALVAVAATTIGVWGLTRIPGEILLYDLFRLAAIGAMNYAILAAAAVRALTDRRPRLVPSGVWRVALPVGLLAIAVTGVLHLESLTSFERRQTRRAIVQAHQAVRDYVASQPLERPLIQIGNDRWGDAAGTLVRLLHDHTPVALKDEHLSMFTPFFAATGSEDALITFADLDLHRELRQRPDNVILLQAFPLFVDARRMR